MFWHPGISVEHPYPILLYSYKLFEPASTGWTGLVRFQRHSMKIKQRLTRVTSFYRSIKVIQSTECQYCSHLWGNIGRFMLFCLYAPPLWFFGNPTYLSQAISIFLIRTMFIWKIFFCAVFLPSQDALLTTCLSVSERAQYMVVCMACMVFLCSVAVAPNHSRCLAGDFRLWFRSAYVLQPIEEFNWFPCQRWALVRLRPLPHSIRSSSTCTTFSCRG